MRSVRESWALGVISLVVVAAILSVVLEMSRPTGVSIAVAAEKLKPGLKRKERKEAKKEADEETEEEEVEPTPRGVMIEEEEEEDDDGEAALERTREQVMMLDDLYKTTLVLITDKYVHAETDFPAGSAAIALFSTMKKKGWHEVRLVDASGDPVMEGNSPQDDFEKQAVAVLKGGKGYYEEVIEEEEGATLRAATPIPVVLEKCMMCHPNYKEAAKGAPIGILSYKVPVK